MSIYPTIGAFLRLHDYALLAEYATDNSTKFHLDQFREELTRVLSGSGCRVTHQQARLKLRGTILTSLHSSGFAVSPEAADALMDLLINIPISDPLLLNRTPPAAIAAE